MRRAGQRSAVRQPPDPRHPDEIHPFHPEKIGLADGWGHRHNGRFSAPLKGKQICTP